MVWDVELFGWRLTRTDGAAYEFVAYTPLKTVRDRAGNEVRLHRNVDKLLTEATTSDGRWVKFTYDTAKRITSATDDVGRTVTYAYDASGRLSTVTDADGPRDDLRLRRGAPDDHASGRPWDDRAHQHLRLRRPRAAAGAR